MRRIEVAGAASVATLAINATIAVAGVVATLAAAATSAAPAPDADAARIGKIYAQTCMACHTSPGSGAPQAGDRAAWQPRLAKGIDVLVDHTIDGYKGMPPLGSCMDCAEADFAELIRFMAGGR